MKKWPTSAGQAILTSDLIGTTNKRHSLFARRPVVSRTKMGRRSKKHPCHKLSRQSHKSKRTHKLYK